MLGYLDIWYFRTPPSHRNTLLHMSITDYLFQISRKNSSCFLFEQKHPKWPIIEVFGILFFNFLENGLNWKTWHFLGKLSWTCVEQKNDEMILSFWSVLFSGPITLQDSFKGNFSKRNVLDYFWLFGLSSTF